MRWSLSEFLSLLDTRSQCWGLVEIGDDSGFRVRANEQVIFHALLEGSATICGVGGRRIALEAGDIAVIISGAAHAVQTRAGAPVHSIAYLDNDEYGDLPHHVAVGGPKAARVLCGRLKVRWPGGLVTYVLPPSIKIDSQDNVINLTSLVAKSNGNGAAALLTRAAALVLTSALRDHPQCQSIVRDANFRDPISRAIQYMEVHSHQDWTVATLATKVGMGRSTFAGRFLAEVGRPPMEVLTDVRMRQAIELLTQTQLKVAEIGERVGYHSQSAFNRRFESYFKTTPGKMRASHFGDSSPGEPSPEAAGHLNPVGASMEARLRQGLHLRADGPPTETIAQSNWRSGDCKAAAPS